MCNRGKRYDSVRFGPTSDILREEYLDMYKGIQSQMLDTTRLHENSDLSTTYLRKTDRSKIARLKQKSPSPYQNKGIPLENYYTDQNAKYC